MSSTVSHRERVLQFQGRQLLMEQLRRSVEQIGKERRSPAHGVAELPREKLDLAQGVSRRDWPAIERSNELSVIPRRQG